EVEALANLENESILVRQVESGLREYLLRWENRETVPVNELRQYDADLAHRLEQDVLKPCIDLRKFNTDQIEQADRENRAIVDRFRWGLLAVGIGAPLSGLLLGYAVAKRLHHSIYQLSVRIRDAAGRLHREVGSVTLEEQGDPPDLHHEMQHVIEEIGRVVEQLQQREHEVLRAEQLAAVGQVAAGVAHELRNPLTSIKMLVQAGQEGRQPAGLPPEDLAVVEKEVRRMEQCIQTFLDFARPPRSERRRTDLTGLVRRAFALVEGRARRQKVALIADLPPEPVYLKIDPEQIHQVLVNLLLNALDAMPRGGTARVGVEPEWEQGQVEGLGQDSGPGIPPRIRARLFEPFVSSKETGLGLGLSICKRLVEAHGATIRGDNAPEGGSVFAFALPLE